MREVYLDLSECKALGDLLCATPTIAVLSKAYGREINVITNNTEVFEGNPDIDELYDSNSFNADYIRNNPTKFIYHNSFHNIGKKNEDGVELKHNRIDIRQFHALNLGFQLKQDEMACKFYPNYTSISIPKPYVLIHPTSTWASRTWDIQKWKQLTKLLGDTGVYVVAIGKSVETEKGFFTVEKGIFNFPIDYGESFINRTNLSDSWHLINKSLCFVTMDSGLLHLAGTTDAQIIQLGSSIAPEFRTPYRSTQDYKFQYLGGKCKIFCGSEMSYGVAEWGDVNGVPPLVGCLERKTSFECHPTAADVFAFIKSRYV